MTTILWWRNGPPKVSDHPGSLTAMSDTQRIDLSVFIEDPESLDETVEALAVRETERFLRSAEITWGPRLGQVDTEYGHTLRHLTVAPELLVEIDVIERVDVALVTIAVDDPRLFDLLTGTLLDFEFAERPAGYRVGTGHAHPERRHMADTLTLLYREVERRRLWTTYDGPLVDEDGVALDD